jgi:undecaprenyl-diphosphatase
MDPHAFVGWLALTALVALVATLGHLDWIDAWVTTQMAALRGCSEGVPAEMLTDAAPYVAALLLTFAAAHAGWRNGHRRKTAIVIGAFFVALLLVQGLKVTFERDRPGAPPFGQSSRASFPSGHTANVALAFAAALAVTRETSGRGRRAARVAVTVAGVALVGAVGFTRLYLNRHWATDTAAGMLIGVAFWSFATARRGAAGHGLVAGAVAVPILGLLAAATGGRIHLPAPSTPSEAGEAGTTLLRRAALHDVVGGEWIRRPRARGFLRLDRPDFALTIQAPHADRAVLKVVASPLLGVASARRCAWIEVGVDGRPVARRPLKPAWRVYAFALPLSQGRNDVEVAVGTPTPRPPALALDAVSIEGGSDGPGIVITASAAEAPGGIEARTRTP